MSFVLRDWRSTSRDAPVGGVHYNGLVGVCFFLADSRKKGYHISIYPSGRRVRHGTKLPPHSELLWCSSLELFCLSDRPTSNWNSDSSRGMRDGSSRCGRYPWSASRVEATVSGAGMWVCMWWSARCFAARERSGASGRICRFLCTSVRTWCR